MKNKELTLLMVISMLLWGSMPAMAIDVSGPGFTHLGGITPSSITHEQGYWLYRTDIITKGFNLMISASPGNEFTNCEAKDVLPNIQTADGNYYGWELSPGSGVYGVIYDSSASGRVWTLPDGGNPNSIIATWAVDGKASTNGTNSMANCYTSIRRGEYFAIRSQEESLSGYLKYGVYVDTTNSKAGNYTLNFYIGTYRGSVTAVSQNFNVNLTSCTVATPSQIQFGNVDVGTTAIVVSPDGDIGISCNGQAPTVNVSYTAQAVSVTQSQTELVMSNTHSQVLGMVRGFIGTNANSEAGCNDTPSSVYFSNSVQSLLNAATNNQANTIPLKWVLCPVSSAIPGEGTASATFNIIWQ